MNPEIIRAVQALGFDVYMRKPTDTWLLYVKGNDIGNLSIPRLTDGVDITSVHVASRDFGTGFCVHQGVAITEKNLVDGFAVAPGWYKGRRDTIKKYKDIEAYRAASTFNQEYALVPKETP